MNFGQWLASTSGVHPEASIHPHAPKERAELFSAVDGGSAEIETLNLLNALVFSSKPNLVLETGTGKGYTTLAIATALEANGFGHLHTIECDSATSLGAKSLLERLAPGAAARTTFHIGDSRELCDTWSGAPFELAFFDSLVAFRHLEFRALRRRGRLGPGTLCIFHDTSRRRGETMPDFNPEMIAALDAESHGLQWLEFGLARGLRLLRVPETP